MKPAFICLRIEDGRELGPYVRISTIDAFDRGTCVRSKADPQGRPGFVIRIHIHGEDIERHIIRYTQQEADEAFNLLRSTLYADVAEGAQPVPLPAEALVMTRIGDTHQVRLPDDFTGSVVVIGEKDGATSEWEDGILMSVTHGSLNA